MKSLLMTVLLILWSSTSLASELCVALTKYKIQRVAPKSKLRTELSKELCKQLIKTSEINWALAIAYVESGIQQVNSLNGQDYGVFQFNLANFKDNQSSLYKVVTSIPYQVTLYKTLFAAKKRMCRYKYPDSWPACWNSATTTLHTEYWSRLKVIYDKLDKL